MFDWMGDAWDSFSNLFGEGGDSPVGDPTSSTGQSVLSDLDIDGDGSVGTTAISDYKPGGDYDFDYDYDDLLGSSPSGSVGPKAPPTKSFSDSLMSAPVLSALITSGAGMLGGMNTLNAQKNALKAQHEQVKMNQMLELAKLKYQLLGKGAGSGRRGGGGASSAQNREDRFSQGQASGYNQLGVNLANIYR